MEATQLTITIVRQTNVLLDLEIKLLQDHIMRMDALIDDCAKLKAQIHKQVSAK
jgi:hypothetical protein